MSLMEKNVTNGPLQMSHQVSEQQELVQWVLPIKYTCEGMNVKFDKGTQIKKILAVSLNSH